MNILGIPLESLIIAIIIVAIVLTAIVLLARKDKSKDKVLDEIAKLERQRQGGAISEEAYKKKREALLTKK